MIVNASTPLSLEWFHQKGPYLVPRDGYESLTAGALRGQAQQNAATDSSAADAAGEKPSHAALPAEQVKRLANTYHPRSMSQDEYSAFVDELCQLGVFSPADQPFLSAAESGSLNLIPLSGSGSMISMTPADFGNACSFDWSFASSGGDVLSWSKYFATFRQLNPYTQTFEPSQSAKRFQKLHDILLQFPA